MNFPWNHRRIVLLFVATCLLSLQSWSQQPSPRMAFIGDTQAPLWIENVFRETNQNEAATRLLLADLAGRKPDRIYILGDVVNLAYKEDRWNAIDSALADFRGKGCSVHACLGNHELMGRPAEGELNFNKRFPDHVNTGYTVVCDSVATVFLNSNFSKMALQQVALQQAWYDSSLKALDTAAAIRAVIVVCHHPPFSDSKLVGSSAQVQKFFVPAFLRSKRCLLFVTGHAHVFQHMVFGGKNFVIAGGGGGLRHPLKKKTTGPLDLAGAYKPMFHYLMVHRTGNGLTVESYRLEEDFGKVTKGYTIYVAPGNP